MVTVTLKAEWDMGHRLPHHQGKCRRAHGHRYVAEVDATGEVHETGPETGMVVDFDRLKPLIKGVIDEWDHRFMLSVDDPMAKMLANAVRDVDQFAGFGFLVVPFMPTAENIAIELMRSLQARSGHPLLSVSADITRVRVYETPNGWAEVRSNGSPVAHRALDMRSYSVD